MKINFSQKLFFTLGLAIFFLPLISSAFVSTGSECYPYPDGVKCPFNRQAGSNVVSVGSNLNVPDNIPTGNLCLVSCLKNGQACAGGIYQEDQSEPAGSDKLRPMPFSEITPTSGGFLKPAVGNIYQKSCHVSGSLLGGDLVMATSSKIQIVSAQPCEITGGSIFSSLNHGNHTTITEANFRDWGIEQTIDRISATIGLGSGDKEDIKNQMTTIQQCVGSFSPEELASLSSDLGTRGLRAMKIYTDARQPVKMSFMFPANSISEVGIHAVVVLEITEQANNNFTVKVLDSNTLGETSGVYDINCGTGTFFYLGKSYNTFVCHHPGGENVVIRFSDRDTVSDLRQSFFNYCQSHSTSRFCTERQNMSLWLENNYPNIPNFNSTSLGANGVCSGWSDFILRVAYLGDFVGTDYHPNDGKIVGRDCTADRYPITTAQKSSWLEPQNWLGNILEPINQLLLWSKIK